MSIHIDERGFADSRPLPVFVLVDPARHRLTSANRADVAGILDRCRAALHHARAAGMAVAFVRDANAQGDQSGWIEGFEPTRDDMIFERRSVSCYSARYFAEMAQTHRELAIAGFLGTGGCVSTAANGAAHGHRITFLRNAVLDDASDFLPPQFSLESLAAFTDFKIRAVETGHWINATTHSGSQKMPKSIDGTAQSAKPNQKRLVPPRARMKGVR